MSKPIIQTFTKHNTEERARHLMQEILSRGGTIYNVQWGKKGAIMVAGSVPNDSRPFPPQSIYT